MASCLAIKYIYLILIEIGISWIYSFCFVPGTYCLFFFTLLPHICSKRNYNIEMIVSCLKGLIIKLFYISIISMRHSFLELDSIKPDIWICWILFGSLSHIIYTCSLVSNAKNKRSVGIEKLGSRIFE